METAIVQKLGKASSNRLEHAQNYYAILSTLNKLYLTEREIQLIAFSAVRGSVSNNAVKEDFISLYGSSLATINNMVSKLKQLKIFIKAGKEIVVNPRIALDFSKPLILQITLTINDEHVKPVRKTQEHASEGISDKEVKSEVTHS